MKELSIEEKAKRYDEAIKRAKELLEIGVKDTRDKRVVLSFFPELKESEDERIRKGIIKSILDLNSDWLELHKVTKKDALAWLEKQGEKKSAWSEEDEAVLDALIRMLEGEDVYISLHSAAEFLKSLKERALPQPKQEWKQENTDDLTDFENAMMHIGNSFFGQYAGLDPNDTNTIKEQANLLLELVPNKEWSEEDENNILFLTSIIEECFKDKENITLYGDTNCANFTKENVINRLKSLRPKNTWKPSDEQINALEYYIYSTSPTATITKGTIYGNLMVELLEQLKKLKKGE